jgi:hypothetical protein
MAKKQEWVGLERVLGSDLLARLVGVTPTRIRMPHSWAPSRGIPATTAS